MYHIYMCINLVYRYADVIIVNASIGRIQVKDWLGPHVRWFALQSSLIQLLELLDTRISVYISTGLMYQIISMYTLAIKSNDTIIGCRRRHISLSLSLVYTLIINYRKISNIKRTKSKNLNESRLVSQLSLSNPLKSCVKSRMKM